MNIDCTKIKPKKEKQDVELMGLGYYFFIFSVFVGRGSLLWTLHTFLGMPGGQGLDCAFGWAISQVACAAGNLERRNAAP